MMKLNLGFGKNYVWIRGNQIRRVMVNGQVVKPVLECFEVL
jgi:hypothetical protein